MIATFAVHTGLRDEELRALRWNWIRETGNVTFFSLPETLTKNGQARPVVLNRSALQVIKRAHGRHPEFVFVHKPRGSKTWKSYSERLLNSAWKKARQRAHLSDVTVHDLRRTCATRLRDCGVSRETRRDILGHTREQGDMARLYAWPTLRTLHEAVEMLCEWRSPELAIVAKA